MARRYFQMLSADRVRRGRHAASRRMFSAENRARKASPSQSAAAIRLPSDAKHSPVDALQKIRSIARPRSSPRRRRPNSTKTVSSASPESVQFARMRIALRGLQHEQPQRAESCAHNGVVCRQSDAAAVRKTICAPNAIVIVAGAGGIPTPQPLGPLSKEQKSEPLAIRHLPTTALQTHSRLARRSPAQSPWLIHCSDQ
jgi:hypothetical protein